jgi:hypothetical protein
MQPILRIKVILIRAINLKLKRQNIIEYIPFDI